MPDKPDLAGKKHENMVRKEIEWENAMSHPCQCKCCKSWKAAHDQIVSLKDIQIKGASEAFTELEEREAQSQRIIAKAAEALTVAEAGAQGGAMIFDTIQLEVIAANPRDRYDRLTTRLAQSLIDQQGVTRELEKKVVDAEEVAAACEGDGIAALAREVVGLKKKLSDAKATEASAILAVSDYKDRWVQTAKRLAEAEKSEATKTCFVNCECGKTWQVDNVGVRAVTTLLKKRSEQCLREDADGLMCHLRKDHKEDHEGKPQGQGYFSYYVKEER